MKSTSRFFLEDLEMSKTCFINLKLIQILEQVSYQHPYNAEYLAFYCLIIWYRKITCAHENDQNCKLDFFNCKEKIKDEQQELRQMCLCRGCDLYDDYIELFHENKWLLEQVLDILQPAVNRNQQYSLEDILEILKKVYIRYIKKWPDQKIVLVLFFAFSLQQFYAKQEDISFSSFFKQFKEETKKEEQDKIINDLILKLELSQNEKNSYRVG